MFALLACAAVWWSAVTGPAHAQEGDELPTTPTSEEPTTTTTVEEGTTTTSEPEPSSTTTTEPGNLAGGGSGGGEGWGVEPGDVDRTDWQRMTALVFLTLGAMFARAAWGRS